MASFRQPKHQENNGSVILDKGISEGILSDMKDFLTNGNSYHNRGIPYHRGYILYGPPGSEKTSYIQALAGELDYNIYILNLSENNLTDDRLNHLMNHIPKRSILLLEDIDTAFNKREQTSDQGYQSGVTFSGLLNALEKVVSAEECITFITTNHPEKLDPVLLHPGRIDYKVMINNVSKLQVECIFLTFYEDTHDLCKKFLSKIEELGLYTNSK